MSVEQVVTDAEKKLELIEQALARLDGFTAVHTSADGLVVAEADAAGALTGLWLDESLCHGRGPDVGRRIVAAATAAAALAATQRDHVFSALTSGIAILAPRSLL